MNNCWIALQYLCLPLWVYLLTKYRVKYKIKKKIDKNIKTLQMKHSKRSIRRQRQIFVALMWNIFREKLKILWFFYLLIFWTMNLHHATSIVKLYWWQVKHNIKSDWVYSLTSKNQDKNVTVSLESYFLLICTFPSKMVLVEKYFVLKIIRFTKKTLRVLVISYGTRSIRSI